MVVFNIAEMVLFKVLCSFRNASMRSLHAHYTVFVHFCHCHCLQSVIANKTVQGFQYSFDKYPLSWPVGCCQSPAKSGFNVSPFHIALSYVSDFFYPFSGKMRKHFQTELRILQLLWCLLLSILCKRCLLSN